MTLQEFKAWFEGFTDGMGDKPNAAQWKKIKAKVAKIDGSVTTYPVFVDRYWPRSWHGPYYGGPSWVTQSSNGGTGQISNNVAQTLSAGAAPIGKNATTDLEEAQLLFDGSQAFADLGRLEARELAQ